MLAHAIDYQTHLQILIQFHFSSSYLNPFPKVFYFIYFAYIYTLLSMKKLDPYDFKCIFLRYSNLQKGYSFSYGQIICLMDV